MNPSPYLYLAFKNLQEVTKDTFSGTSISDLSDTINTFAVSSAIAGGLAGGIPAAGVIAAIAQTGLVWTMYVKINKKLGISMSKDTMKFVGSAIVTNIITNAGSMLAGYAGATILSFVPVVGQIAGPLLGMAIGYMIIYVSAVIYFNLLTEVFKTNGSFQMDESQNIKDIIKRVVKAADLSEIIKEGKNAFKTAKKNGDIDRAKMNPKCPSCGADITPGQKFCSSCGAALV